MSTFKSVIGIDLGLKKIACCTASEGRLRFHVLELPEDTNGAARHAVLLWRAARAVQNVVRDAKPPVSVWVEAHGYGIQHGNTEKDLAELHGAVKAALYAQQETPGLAAAGSHNLTFAFVSAGEARKMVLGRGAAPKGQKTKEWVRAEAARLGARINDGLSHDEVDALIVADFGAMQVGYGGVLQRPWSIVRVQA